MGLIQKKYLSYHAIVKIILIVIIGNILNLSWRSSRPAYCGRLTSPVRRHEEAQQKAEAERTNEGRIQVRGATRFNEA